MDDFKITYYRQLLEVAIKKPCNVYLIDCCKVLAERKGFEPLDRKCGQRFSRPPRSTTPASLRLKTTKLRTHFRFAKIHFIFHIEKFIFFFFYICNTNNCLSVLFENRKNICLFVFLPFFVVKM